MAQIKATQVSLSSPSPPFLRSRTSTTHVPTGLDTHESDVPLSWLSLLASVRGSSDPLSSTSPFLAPAQGTSVDPLHTGRQSVSPSPSLVDVGVGMSDGGGSEGEGEARVDVSMGTEDVSLSNSGVILHAHADGRHVSFQPSPGVVTRSRIPLRQKKRGSVSPGPQRPHALALTAEATHRHDALWDAEKAAEIRYVLWPLL